MEEGEKLVKAGAIRKKYGLPRWALTDLETYDGLNYYQFGKQHQWYMSDVLAAVKHREERRMKESAARLEASNWNNGASILADGCRAELKATRARTIKEQDAYIKRRSDQAVREIEADKEAPVVKGDMKSQCHALLRA